MHFQREAIVMDAVSQSQLVCCCFVAVVFFGLRLATLGRKHGCSETQAPSRTAISLINRISGS